MKKTIALVLLGIILENIVNLYLNEINILNPLFTVFIFEIFRSNKKRYFTVSFIIGFIYDLFFTNFYIFNSFVFLFISIIIYYLLIDKNLNYKIYLISTLIIIFLYNVLLFIILNFFNYTNYNITDLSNIILSYIIINYIYVTSVYLINKKIIHTY